MMFFSVFAKMFELFLPILEGQTIEGWSLTGNPGHLYELSGGQFASTNFCEVFGGY